VTRPYRWTSLLAAKALFLVAFIHLPLLAADLTILAGQGFAPSLRTLLWRQFGLAALVTLPAAAIASVTRTLAALALTGVATLTCVAVVFAQFDSVRHAWPGAEWIRGTAILAVLVVGAAATLVWQYARRRTAVGRAVAGSGFGLFLAVIIAPPFGSWILSRTPADPAGLRSIRVVATEPLPEKFLTFGLRFDGVPKGMRVEPQLVAIVVGYDGGREWRSGWASRFQGGPLGGLQWTATAGEISVASQPWGVSELRARPATVHASVILSVYGRETTQGIPVDGRPHSTPIGRCAFRHAHGAPQLDVICWNSEFTQRGVQIDTANVSIGPYSYMNYLSAGPILESEVSIDMTPPPGDTITLTTEPPVTRIRRDVEIPIQVRR
jgi:hypothetical protein